MFFTPNILFRKFHRKLLFEKNDPKLKSLTEMSIGKGNENSDKRRQEELPRPLINSTIFGKQSNIFLKPLEFDKDKITDKQEDIIHNPLESKNFEKITLSVENKKNHLVEDFALKINFLLEKQKQFDDNVQKLNDEIKELKDQNVKLIDQNGKLDKEIGKLDKEVGKLDKELGKVDKEIGKLFDQNLRLTERVDTNEQIIKNMSQEIKDLQRLLNAVFKRGNTVNSH